MNTMHKYQNGLSLIELMIAVALGLMALSSLGYIMVGSQGTYRAQSASARVMDTGRNAMNFIGQNLRIAGRVDITPLATDIRFGLPDNTVPISGSDGVNAGDPDTLIVNYQLSNSNGASIEDCNGNGAGIAKSNLLDAAGATIGQYGTVQNTIAINVASSELTCTGNGAAASQPVSEGIEDLQILYGVDTDNDGAVNSWQSASAVANWSQVLAAQVCMMVRSVDTGVVSAPQSLTDCFGNNIVAPDTALRRMFTSVFVLRSRINALPQ